MALTNFTAPSFSQILQSLINDYVAVTAAQGYQLSVDPGSEVYLRLSTVATQLALAYQVMNNMLDARMPDTANGDDLDRLAANYGLYRRGSTSAQGFVALIASVPITLVTGTLLVGSNGLQYQVSQTGVYNPNQNVPVVSVDQGSQTNLAIGSIMVWSSPQANMQSTTTVSIAITGGSDSEDDATLRNRLFLTLQNPPQMGNPQQIVTLSGQVDNIVQQAFLYNDFNGAGTQLIALAGFQTTSYVGRDIPHLQYDGYAKPFGFNQVQPGLVAPPPIFAGTNAFGPYNQYSSYVTNAGQNLSTDISAIYGQLPGTIANPYATVITTVNNIPSDVAAVLTLPYPVGAPTNGLGGGWIDFTPWPVPDGNYVPDGYCKVVSVQGAGAVVGGQTGFGITVRAPSSGSYHTNPPYTSAQAYNVQTPTPGQTHIQWVNRSDAQETGWTVVQATILGALDNGNDTWSLTLDTPLSFPTDGYDFYGNTGVAVGDFIFPAATNAQNYLNLMMQQFALLGPNQVTSSAGLLALGAARYPSPSAVFPSVLGVNAEKALVTNNTEVFEASVNSQNFTGFAGPNHAAAYNSAFSVTAWGIANSVASPASVLVTAPPTIFVPRNLAFYPTESYNFGTV